MDTDQHVTTPRRRKNHSYTMESSKYFKRIFVGIQGHKERTNRDPDIVREPRSPRDRYRARDLCETKKTSSNRAIDLSAINQLKGHSHKSRMHTRSGSNAQKNTRQAHINLIASINKIKEFIREQVRTKDETTVEICQPSASSAAEKIECSQNGSKEIALEHENEMGSVTKPLERNRNTKESSPAKNVFINKVYEFTEKHYTSEYTDGSNHWYFPNADYSFFYSREYNTTTKVYRRLKTVDKFLAAQRTKKKTKNKRRSSPPPGPLFMGRDKTYPMDLNQLMFMNYCSLCNVRLASTITAHEHFVSRTHDRRVSTWLKRTYTDKGLEPPKLKRHVANAFPTDVIPKLKNEYKCKDCNLHLSRVQRALEHFNGKRHREKILQKTQLAGIGYFNLNGEWVHTGKVIDKVTGERTNYVLVKTPVGLQPVVLFSASKPSMESFELNKNKLKNSIWTPELCLNADGTQELEKNEQNDKNDSAESRKIDCLQGRVENNESLGLEEPAAKKIHLESKAVEPSKEKNIPVDRQKIKQSKTLQQKTPNKETPTSTTEYKSVAAQRDEYFDQFQAPYEAINAEYCTICNIGVTSREQMIPHLLGLRHAKKLRALGANRLMAEDLSEQRTTTVMPTILDSLGDNNPIDLSLYRTPTGTYYCQLCNVKALEISRLRRHLFGKKHRMAVKRNAAAQ